MFFMCFRLPKYFKKIALLKNYSVKKLQCFANMTHIKTLHTSTTNCHEKRKNNCVNPKTFQNMTLRIKEKKNNLTKKKNHFYEPWRNRDLAFVENRVVRRLMKIVPFGQHENPKMKVSIIKQAQLAQGLRWFFSQNWMNLPLKCSLKP